MRTEQNGNTEVLINLFSKIALVTGSFNSKLISSAKTGSLPCSYPSWILCPALRSLPRCLPVDVWWCCPAAPGSSPRNWTDRRSEKILVLCSTTSPCIVENSDRAWLTRGYCLTGMSTRSFTLTFLAVNRSRYVSDSFLGSPFWTLSISAKEKSVHSYKKWPNFALLLRS